MSNHCPAWQQDVKAMQDVAEQYRVRVLFAQSGSVRAFGGKVATRLTGTLRGFQNWRQQRIAARELRALPDELLRDIGISRYQIDQVVQQGSKRKRHAPLIAQHPAVVSVSYGDTTPTLPKAA